MLRKFVWIQEELKQVCGGKSTEHHQKGCGHCRWLRKAGTQVCFWAKRAFRKGTKYTCPVHGGPGELSQAALLHCGIFGSTASGGCPQLSPLPPPVLPIFFCPVLPRCLSWVRSQGSFAVGILHNFPTGFSAGSIT